MRPFAQGIGLLAQKSRGLGGKACKFSQFFPSGLEPIPHITHLFYNNAS